MIKTQNNSRLSKKKVVFIGFWPDYEALSFDIGQDSGVDIEVVNLKESKYRCNIFKRWSKKAKLNHLRKLIQQLTTKHPEKSFYFQDKERLTRILLDIPINFQAGIICRDIVAKNKNLIYGMEDLKKKGIKIWSFDKGDCKTYSLKNYSQFVRKFPIKNNPTPTIDLLFVGRNKGRKPLMDKLNTMLSDAGLKVCLKIFNRKVDRIPYQEYLSLIADSKCLLDIVQGGQNGLTLRPVEAAIYGKKLITDNVFVKETTLYHPNNVLILSDTTKVSEITSFLTTAYKPIADEVLYEYSPENFMANLLTIQ